MTLLGYTYRTLHICVRLGRLAADGAAVRCKCTRARRAGMTGAVPANPLALALAPDDGPEKMLI